MSLRLLGDANIAKLSVAYLVSYTGTAMAPIAIAFGVLELTGSAADASLVIAAPTFAAILVLLIGGVLADRSSRKRIMYCAELLAMCAQAYMAYLFLSGTATIAWLTTCMLLLGVAMACHAPAATGLIIQLVDKAQLQSANAILGTARNGAMAAGAALGGVLVATFGAGITLLIDAISFGLSALLVMTLTPRHQRKPEAASVIEDLRLGWREFTSHTWLWVIVLQFALVVAAMESIYGLLGPAVVREHLGGAANWGFIASGFGLGTLAGGLIGMYVKPLHPMRFATCCVFFFAGVPLALMILAPVPAIVATAFIGGTAGQTFAVLWYTTLQHKVPGEMLSRVSAYDHLGSIGLAPLGIVFAGWLFEWAGYRTTLLIAALTVILPTIATLCVRDVRHMTGTSDAVLATPHPANPETS